jgi:xanthine dehydrogenase accessory factor
MSLPQSDIERFATAACGAQGRWLEPLAGHWTESAHRRLASRTRVVRITVVTLRGSAPREPGATMLVDADGALGTIGGGQLEWRATALARAQLDDATASAVRVVELVLGPDLGQCCGGRIELWFERLTREDAGWLAEAANRLRAGRAATLASEVTHGFVTHRLMPALSLAMRLRFERGPDADLRLIEPLLRAQPPLYIFGAGHVGQALVRLLADLAMFDILWVDTRAGMLPEDLPADVRALVCDAPVQLARDAASGTRFIVMTHDHALDYELCRAVLQRPDSCWLGLIGSQAKSARFRSRLLRDGLPAETLSHLHCPIGVPRIASKLPAAVAIAIAAQLLQHDAGEAAAPITPEARDTTCAAAGGCESCGRRL